MTLPDARGMSIASRPPGTDGPAPLAPGSGQRPGGESAFGSSLSSVGELLPPAGSLARDPVSAPTRALARDARRWRRYAADPIARPARWSEPAFQRELTVIRAHLAPLRTRRSLAASFAREAFLRLPADAPGATDDETPDEPSPVRLAYAIRWTELSSA